MKHIPAFEAIYYSDKLSINQVSTSYTFICNFKEVYVLPMYLCA